MKARLPSLFLTLGALCLPALPLLAADAPFNGLGTDIGNLFRLSHAKSRSISPENFTGEKGKGAMATTEGAS